MIFNEYAIQTERGKILVYADSKESAVKHLRKDGYIVKSDSTTTIIDLKSALERLLAAAPAFRSKPIGAEGSEARKQQEEHIAAEDAARELLAKLEGK